MLLRWFLEKRMDGKTTSAFVLGILDRLSGLHKRVGIFGRAGRMDEGDMLPGALYLQNHIYEHHHPSIFPSSFLEEFLKGNSWDYIAGRERGAK